MQLGTYPQKLPLEHEHGIKSDRWRASKMLSAPPLLGSATARVDKNVIKANWSFIVTKMVGYCLRLVCIVDAEDFD